MLLKFINRKVELQALEQAYRSSRAEFFVIYGRRRIGKTELLKQFSKDKTHFYYLAKKQKLELELEEFQRKFAAHFNIYLKPCTRFEDLFREIFIQTRFKEKVVIIIDEFPYWIAEDKKVLSEFQYLWDEILTSQSVFLILCGSYMSVMEEQVLGVKSPLYGRRSGQIKVEPLHVKNLASFFPHYSVEDLIKIYGAVGTVPFYLKEMSDSLSFIDNIKNTFFNKANILHQEAEFLLREELREVNVYFNILKTIIDGSTTLTEIATKSRVDITNINKYLATLLSLRLITKIKPLTASNKEKKYLYKIADNYFRFWLTFVYPYQSEIEENSSQLQPLLQQEYPHYLGVIFEDICQKIIKDMNIKISKIGLEVGTWWYKDKEIDLLAINEKTSEILLGECKWQEQVDAMEILSSLKEKANFVEWRKGKRKECWVIFAKSFKKKISEEGLYLYDLKDIEKVLQRT
ncbi:TPA: ATP-binding protein [Candidatus Woesearchaeota archaeon]|nr:ATP-binding protein [Candidatus Woesearchaeota archaeon]HIG93777.1 ATP-binding protein [Candidatus Woesearchaeota archaeon]HIH13045.1 ATP-binding protein [Candidatus Woesearchaeota archaeon]